MPLLVAVALYGGAFIGYVVGEVEKKPEPPAATTTMISVQSMIDDVNAASTYRLIGNEGDAQ